MSQSSPTPTLRLAEFIAGVTYDRLPQNIREQLFVLFLDYLRVASIGERMEWSRWAADLARKLGGNGDARVLFSSERCDPVRAGFLNTTYAGSIDADDVHVGAMLHPGCIVFSAALAIGQDRHLPGDRVMAAVVAGYETMIRIALCIQPSHFRRGFQSTATCGGFGAAAAAAHLLFEGKDRVRRIAETLGLVASFCGGLTQFYHSGSTVKRIHAAHAAGEGLHAALLAEAGYSGPTDILEGRDGFARAYADEVDWSALDDLGSGYRMLEVAIKAHACSARVQATIEATAALCLEHAVRAADVKGIRVGIPKVIQGRLTVNKPRDLQAAQMSVPFCAALTASLGGKLGPGFALNVDDFEAGMSDAAVMDLSRRVECVLDDEVERVSNTESVGAKVTLITLSGAEHTAFVPTPKGSPSRPFTATDHVERFRHELRSRLAPTTCDGLIDTIRNVGTLADIGELAEKLA
ncbi:MAG: MmgE/PrpD family protein [Burkholderiales bacterium]|nr:MmgE/PrpD family protein [Burkholderiales bacterium]